MLLFLMCKYFCYFAYCCLGYKVATMSLRKLGGDKIELWFLAGTGLEDMSIFGGGLSCYLK